MEYRNLGTTGIRVSTVSLGVMNLTGTGDQSVADCIAMVHRALDEGVNLVDTADVYGHGASEVVLGQALAGRRDDVIVATKAHGAMGEDPNMRGNSRRWLIRACDDSLRRLGTDYIDLYQVHRPDPACSVEETLQAMSSLVTSGKVRYIGTSTFPASQLVEAQWIAQQQRLRRFTTEQAPYSMLVRGIEDDVLPTCQRHGIGVLTWGPLAGGWLSGRVRSPGSDPHSRTAARMLRADLSDAAIRHKLDVVDRLGELADEVGIALPLLAVAWATEHPGVSSVLLGPRTMTQLDSLLPAAHVSIEESVLDAIDLASPPGTNVMEQDAAKDWLYGAPMPPSAAGRRRAEIG